MLKKERSNLDVLEPITQTLEPRTHMDPEAFRADCLSFPGVTEDLKWEHDLVFSVGKKMFAVLVLEPTLIDAALFLAPVEKHRTWDSRS